MYKIHEKYTDWLGNEREEDFHFNISQSELTKMQFSKTGGLDEYIKKIIATQDQTKLIEIFEQLIDLSYGEISADGRKFVKTEEILEDFKSTAAYSQIYIRLASDSTFAAEFINNVFPRDIINKAKEENLIPEALNGKVTSIEGSSK